MKYLLVLGTQRSGKTLISRALNTHPNIILQMEPFFFFFKMCRNILFRDVLKKTDFDPDYPMDSGFCKSHEEKQLLKEYFLRLEFTHSDIEELKVLTVKQNREKMRAPKIIPFLDKLQAGTAPTVLKCLLGILNEAYKKQEVMFVGLSEGWCDEYIEILLNYDDMDFRCIHCIRDPRAIVASRNGDSKLHVGKYPLLFIIRHWRKTIAYSILCKDNPKYMSARYENVVREPEKWFREICGFMGVPFSERLLETSLYVNGDGSLWQRNTAYKGPIKEGFSTDSVERWEGILSRDEVGFIEYLCKAEMDYLGIKRKNQTFSLRDLAAFREDENAITDWLKKYNLTINDEELNLEIVRKYLIENQVKHVNDMMLNYFVIDKDVAKKLKPF
jgi:hypothetical protein